MQIHELNKQSNGQQIQEALTDYLPQAVVDLKNLGKEVIKNPKAWTDSAQLGAAKQAATQQSAADNAAKLAAKGYSTTPKATTSQQQYQAVKTNPGVQQQVKNISSQWKAVATPIIANLAKNKSARMSEEIVSAQPNSAQDPKVKTTLSNLYAQRPGAYGQVNYNVPTQTQQATNAKQVDSDLLTVSNEFKRWAKQQLSNAKINLDAIERDSWAKSQLEQSLLKIATYSLADPGSPTTLAAVEDFFNIAYAANIATSQSAQSVAQAQASNAPSGSSAQGQQTPEEVLKQYGLTITQPQITDIAAAMSRATKGGKVIRNTANPVLNALAQLAGFQIGR